MLCLKPLIPENFWFDQIEGLDLTQLGNSPYINQDPLMTKLPNLLCIQAVEEPRHLLL